ncbi:MAG: VOC family protein [Oceanospirillaceae bacterium]|nr:VOC family protein [Oceanospirillaceae bacterium]
MPIGPSKELTAQLAVEIYVSNLKRSLAFYKALGFSIARCDDTFAVIRWDESYIFLDQRNQVAPTSDMPVANVRVVVNHIDTLWEQVQAANMQVLNTLTTQTYGLRDFTIADPDGFGVRFAEII